MKGLISPVAKGQAILHRFPIGRALRSELAVMLIAAAGSAASQSYGTNGCSSNGGFWILNAEPDRGFHLTTAPYDRMAGQELPRGAGSPTRTPLAAPAR